MDYISVNFGTDSFQCQQTTDRHRPECPDYRHSLFNTHVPLLATEERSPAMDSLGNIRKHTYPGPRNHKALRLLIIVRYTITLSYLLTISMLRAEQNTTPTSAK